MLSEAGLIRLYEQQFAGAALPEVGAGLEGKGGEEARVRAATIGVYELWFRQQPHYEFSGGIFLNAEKPERDELQKQFEVSEDIAEAERTLTIQSKDGVNLDLLEIIPLDWRDNPLEFTQLDVSQRQRKIRYRNDSPPESLKIKFSGLNVFEVETIDAVLWANGRDFSLGKLAAFIRRSEDIRIDRLDNSKGDPRKIEEHLLAFFGLLLEKAPNRTFDFECSYRYYAVAGGPHAFVPVLFRRSLNLQTAGELFSELLPELENWYQRVSPPAGVFDFGVKVYGTGSRESNPILHLTGLVLPIESVAGWKDNRASDELPASSG